MWMLTAHLRRSFSYVPTRQVKMSVEYPLKIHFGVTRRYVTQAEVARDNDHKDSNKTRAITNTSIIKFSPKLSLQRYATVAEVMADFANCSSSSNGGSRLQRVTEFGSGSFQFLYRFLHMHDFVEIVDQIDVDYGRIMSAIHLVSMEIYRPRCRARTKSLIVNVFCGDVTLTDSRIRHSDAVVAIELIEHLNPDQLEYFIATIFNFIQPKLAVFTTPNHEFNALFDNDIKTYRHHDHKFEFTRSQFENWTATIVARYNHYEVAIYGIGNAPATHISQHNQPPLDVGFCTQMAVFKKIIYPIAPIPSTFADHESYKLLGSYQWQ